MHVPTPRESTVLTQPLLEGSARALPIPKAREKKARPSLTCKATSAEKYSYFFPLSAQVLGTAHPSRSLPGNCFVVANTRRASELLERGSIAERPWVRAPRRRLCTRLTPSAAAWAMELLLAGASEQTHLPEPGERSQRPPGTAAGGERVGRDLLQAQI